MPGPVVLITGELGVTARMLVAECSTWAEVVLSSASQPPDGLESHARHTRFSAHDVDSATALLDDIANEEGPLSMLVVNSADRTPPHGLDPAELEHDIVGTLALIELAAERMAAAGGTVVHVARDFAPYDPAAAAIAGATPDYVAQLRPVRINTIEVDGELLDALGHHIADAAGVAALVNGYGSVLACVGDLCRFLHVAERVSGTTTSVRHPEFFYELG